MRTLMHTPKLLKHTQRMPYAYSPAMQIRGQTKGGPRAVGWIFQVSWNTGDQGAPQSGEEVESTAELRFAESAKPVCS